MTQIVFSKTLPSPKQLSVFKTQVPFSSNKLDLSLKSVEEIIKSKDKFQNELEKTNEALKTYLVELKKLRQLLSETDEDKNGSEGVKENYMKKAMKCKKLEDDNK